jgi:hypothetical protein
VIEKRAASKCPSFRTLKRFNTAIRAGNLKHNPAGGSFISGSLIGKEIVVELA